MVGHPHVSFGFSLRIVQEMGTNEAIKTSLGSGTRQCRLFFRVASSL